MVLLISDTGLHISIHHAFPRDCSELQLSSWPSAEIMAPVSWKGGRQSADMNNEEKDVENFDWFFSVVCEPRQEKLS